MQYLALFIVVIIIIEGFDRLRALYWGKQLIACLNKVRHVLFSKKISDHWKERALLIYAGQMARLSFILLLILFCLLTLALTVLIAADSLVAGSDALNFSLSLVGGLWLTIFAVGYAVLRRRFIGH